MQNITNIRILVINKMTLSTKVIVNRKKLNISIRKINYITV